MITSMYKDEAPEELKGAIDWANSTFFGHLPYPIECWMAGGALRSFFTGNSPRDYDLFFPSQEAYDELFNLLTKLKFTPKYDTEKSVCLKHPKPDKPDVELIKGTWYSAPEETLEHFDFTVTRCAVTDDMITVDTRFLEDLKEKRLVIANLEQPMNTLWRIQKYNALGFKMDPQNLFRLAESFTVFDFDAYDPDTLGKYE